MSPPVKVAFASGSEDLIPTLIEKLAELGPEAPLYLVSEFPFPGARWIPYHPFRRFGDNLALCRAALRDKKILFAGLILQPRMPYWRLRWLALRMAPWRAVFFNENLNHFMLRPRSVGVMVRHVWWRMKNLARWELRPGGATYTLLWRLAHPSAFIRPVLFLLASGSGWVAATAKRMTPAARLRAALPSPETGISVVIPSRNGRPLLERLLGGLFRELQGIPSEVIVVDNGSSDGTAEFLAAGHPQARVESSVEPLSFARAANRGIGAASFSHVCLLNNDMVLEPGFFGPLLAAFDRVPDLFCATAQILFPEGARRQETGKAVMPRRKPGSSDFPVRCDLPIQGEDLSYVLYGSGGCSLYEREKLHQLGGLGEVYAPAYVEDLDLGYRGWQRGWPTVFVAGARVVHFHRATTSQYYTKQELDRVLEVNYLRFLARSIASPALFGRLWREALGRLNRLAGRMEPVAAAMAALKEAWRAPWWVEAAPAAVADERLILALGSGDVAVFPGAPAGGKPVVLIASPYLPFPLSHGGAVRMYNLMRRAAADYAQVLVSFVDELSTPPAELLEVCAELVQVRRQGSHFLTSSPRPDVVEQFDSPAFRAALRQLVRKWRPAIAQLEFTQLAQYAGDCAPAKTILVEHDVTLDLYQQLLAQGEDWELRYQHERWVRFETAAWREVDAVVTMSEQDRRMVGLPSAVALPNGVDLERFRPSPEPPEPARLLFIGSFAHLPNVLAVDFFLREVWPLIAHPDRRLHIIGGKNHRYFLDSYRDRAQPPLDQPDVEVEDFVADPRPAYRRASIVIAPLLASAGTNIKIMEAMAMGKAIVSTPAGINGLDTLTPGADVVVAPTAAGMALEISGLLSDPERRRSIEQKARATVERHFNWDDIARRQAALYESLRAKTA